jgi:CheY-like chemotaxis protein
VDLVISDFVMPVLSGAEVITQIRLFRPYILGAWIAFVLCILTTTYLINPFRPVSLFRGVTSGLPLALIGNASGQTFARSGDLDPRRFR